MSQKDVYLLVSKLKKTKTKFLRCTGYLNSIKKYKARCLLILVLVRPQNFLRGRYGKIYSGLSKVQVKFWINLKLEISMRPVVYLRFFYSLHYFTT